jgi:hypothetical protein
VVEAVKDAYPRNEVTLRQACRVLCKRERPGAPASVDADPGDSCPREAWPEPKRPPG